MMRLPRSERGEQGTPCSQILASAWALQGSVDEQRPSLASNHVDPAGLVSALVCGGRDEGAGGFSERASQVLALQQEVAIEMVIAGAGLGEINMLSNERLIGVM